MESGEPIRSKAIRIPVSCLRDTGPGPNYTINSSWLNRVQEVVNYAYSRGVCVVINMHGDGCKSVKGSWLICDSSSQTEIKTKYQKVWQQIASKFQSPDLRGHGEESRRQQQFTMVAHPRPEHKHRLHRGRESPNVRNGRHAEVTLAAR